MHARRSSRSASASWSRTASSPGSGPAAVVVDAAEHNGALAHAAGVRWLRDVGAPIGVDPVDGRERALSLGVRDRWVGRRDRPYIRAAGSWLSRAGTLPARPIVEV